MGIDLHEGTVAHAVRATRIAVLDRVRFVVASAVSAATGGIAAEFALPDNVLNLWRVLLVGISSIGGVLITIVALFLGYLILAPYRQRDVARTMLATRAKQGLQVLGPYSRMSEVDGSVVPLWYVEIANLIPDSIAKNVRVRMDNPEPQIIMSFLITLHRIHDNIKPYEKMHEIRYGDPVILDLVVCGQLNPDMYYLFRADGDERSQEGLDWMLSTMDNDIIDEASRQSSGWQFNVVATPDPPMARASMRFRLKRTSDDEWPFLEALSSEVTPAPEAR